MDFSGVIMLVVAVSFGIACIDRCIGNKFGLGASLESGFGLMGPIALSIVGMICISPVLAKFLQPIVVPAYAFLGADAAMFAPTFLSADSGGYVLASELSQNAELVRFAGLIVGVVMGPIISFVIPVGIGMVAEADRGYFATGVMTAFMAAPFGCLVGALACGLPLGVAAINLVPIFIFSIALAVAFFFIPQRMIKIFAVFARLMTIIITAGLGIATFQTLTGIVFVEGLGEVNTGFITAGTVTLIIAGSFPLMKLIETVFKRPLHTLAQKIGINESSLSNLIISCVSSLPAFAAFDKMDPRGKVLVSAFAGSGAFIIGPHLGYVSSVDKSMIMPMFAAKVTAGALALILAVYFANRAFQTNETNETKGEIV